MGYPRRPNVDCSGCQTSFWPKRAGQKYCSLECVPREVFVTAKPGPRPKRRKDHCDKHPGSLRYERRDGSRTDCRECRRESQREDRARRREAGIKRPSETRPRVRSEVQKERARERAKGYVLTDEQRERKRQRDQARDQWRATHKRAVRLYEQLGPQEFVALARKVFS